MQAVLLTAALLGSFITPEQTRGTMLLAAPPAAGSNVSLRELAELHQLEHQRTRSQIEHAQRDDRDESIFLFQDVLGPAFNAASLPATAALSADLQETESANTDPLKLGYYRQRPYNLDPSLHPVCKTKAKNDSYPSGHTTAGYLQALTLVEIVPEYREQIFARAADYANSRLVCGVHFRSDTEASRVLAYAMHALVREQPAYQQKLAAARKEVRRALKLDPQ